MRTIAIIAASSRVGLHLALCVKAQAWRCFGHRTRIRTPAADIRTPAADILVRAMRQDQEHALKEGGLQSHDLLARPFLSSPGCGAGPSATPQLQLDLGPLPALDWVGLGSALDGMGLEVDVVVKVEDDLERVVCAYKKVDFPLKSLRL